MESIKNKLFGKSEIIDSESMRSIYGGFAQTKTKGSKTKETAQDKDSSASQENPQQQFQHAD
ncbi:hypothetical protein [Tenacibaculum xiamenense]|uniref:hypothetical protein n=1 Tax=Tenacibaculum xiamenense TaxID=1261553 RepID=UPI0038B64B8A